MNYSQNKEDILIAGFFGSFVGSLLSLGENDGITLSNSRALVEKGWRAELVEPSPTAFAKLQKLYGEADNVKMHNVAIGSTNCRMSFYDSGTLLKKGDESLVSTLCQSETLRWGNSVTFNRVEVDVITFAELLNRSCLPTFDFISVDCEGMDLEILRQINLTELGCRCICIEFNGKDEDRYFHHVRKHGFQLIHKNKENLIYVK